RIIRKATAGSGKKLSLELGGKSPFIVFDDADLDSVVEGVVDAIWFNQGQVCCAGSRLLVHEGIAERLVTKLRARMEKLRVGPPLDKAIDMGAIVAPVQLERIRSLVNTGVEEGATMWQPSWACPTDGYFYPPTLFTNVSPAATIAQVEIFGPVLVSMTFRTPAEAVELANNTPYGLAASVWTENINLALDVAPKIKAGDRGGWRDVREQSGRVEVPLCGTRPRRLPHRGAFRDPGAHQRADALELHRRHDRTHIDRLVERRADPQLFHPRPQLRHQPLGDALVRQQPRPRAAHLPLVEPDRVHHALDDAVQIGVVEYEERALAAELERQLLARPGGRLADDASHLRRAREGDFVDVAVRDQQPAGTAVARDDVQHAGGEPGLMRDLGQAQRRERRELRRLEHHGVSGRERRRDLPGEHQEREVPGDDLPHDAHGTVARELGLDELRPPRVM